MNALQHLLRATGLRRGPAAPEPMRGSSGLGQQADGCEPGVRLARDAERDLARLQYENERLQAVGQARSQWFASAIHDLRQPLQALVLFSEALAEEPPSSLQHRHVARVRQSVASLDRLCVVLLDLAQLEAGRGTRATEPVILEPVLDELRHTFSALARRQGLRLVVRPSSLCVRGDALMLTRILNNLVCNALQNTLHGGVLVGVRRRSGELCIEVHDTGTGMAQAHQPHVFQPSDQVPQDGEAPGVQGDGLGLSTARHLAQLQGARISLRSQPQRGTVVSVHLMPASASQG